MVEISLDNPLVANFVYHSAVGLGKVLAVTLLTTSRRMRKEVYLNPEDVQNFISEPEKRKKGVVTNDPDVERARSNHRNDLENLPVFIFLGGFYVLTDPSLTVALWHFRVFTCARILHTVCYQKGLQPWRFICHMTSFGVMISMGYRVIRTTYA